MSGFCLVKGRFVEALEQNGLLGCLDGSVLEIFTPN